MFEAGYDKPFLSVVYRCDCISHLTRIKQCDIPEHKLLCSVFTPGCYQTCDASRWKNEGAFCYEPVRDKISIHSRRCLNNTEKTGGISTIGNTRDIRSRRTPIIIISSFCIHQLTLYGRPMMMGHYS